MQDNDELEAVQKELIDESVSICGLLLMHDDSGMGHTAQRTAGGCIATPSAHLNTGNANLNTSALVELDTLQIAAEPLARYSIASNAEEVLLSDAETLPAAPALPLPPPRSHGFCSTASAVLATNIPTDPRLRPQPWPAQQSPLQTQPLHKTSAVTTSDSSALLSLPALSADTLSYRTPPQSRLAAVPTMQQSLLDPRPKINTRSPKPHKSSAQFISTIEQENSSEGDMQNDRIPAVCPMEAQINATRTHNPLTEHKLGNSHLRKRRWDQVQSNQNISKFERTEAVTNSQMHHSETQHANLLRNRSSRQDLLNSVDSTDGEHKTTETAAQAAVRAAMSSTNSVNDAAGLIDINDIVTAVLCGLCHLKRISFDSLDTDSVAFLKRQTEMQRLYILACLSANPNMLVGSMTVGLLEQLCSQLVDANQAGTEWWQQSDVTSEELHSLAKRAEKHLAAALGSGAAADRLNSGIAAIPPAFQALALCFTVGQHTAGVRAHPALPLQDIGRFLQEIVHQVRLLPGIPKSVQCVICQSHLCLLYVSHV